MTASDMEGSIFEAARKRDQGEMFSLRRANEARPDLSGKPPVEIVAAPRRYEGIPPSMARKRALREATDPEGGILGVYRNVHTGWEIEVNKEGVDKSLSGDGSLARTALVWKLPELLGRALRVESHPDADARRQIAEVHRFVAAATLDGKVRRVVLTVREYDDGRKIHRAIDHAEIELPGEGLGPRAGAEAATLPTPGTINVVDILRGVKYSDGTDVLPGEAFSLRREGGAIRPDLDLDKG